MLNHNNVFAQPEKLVSYKLKTNQSNDYLIDMLSDVDGVFSVAQDLLIDESIITIYADANILPTSKLELFLSTIMAASEVQIDIVESEIIDNINWVVHSWQANPIQKIADILIYGSHHEKSELPKVAKMLHLDAGAAFGTGEHGTTSGCLIAISEIIKKHNPKTILDMGCGTALLAMVAALYKKNAQILAVDNDKVAVQVALENIKQNKLNHIVKADVGNGFKSNATRGKKYDLIIANILARPIRAMAGDMIAHLNNGGYLILSGFYRRDIRYVYSQFQARGLYLTKIIKNQEWAILILKKHR
jgi:ribosomal protein L11 methyltransferase